MTGRWKIDLSNLELFGNEVAEDEEERLFASYAYVREEFADFLRKESKVRIVRAYKGEGKSALLRWAYLQLKGQEDVVVHSTQGSALNPMLPATAQSAERIRAWSESLIAVAASALGASLGLKFSDDVVSLREEAERGGYKQRGFVASILARLKGLPGGPNAAGAADPTESLKRVAGSSDVTIWLIVDDLDENFRNVDDDCLSVMAALVAMRQLSNEIPELRFRASIRPSTWAIISPKFEALSKVAPYVFDLQWTMPQLEGLLASRVTSYLRRNSGPAVASGTIHELDAQQLVALVFDDPMPWGKKEVEAGLVDDQEASHKRRSPAVVISTLARYRPRWMIELCKLAAKSAIRRSNATIGLDDLTAPLDNFGQTRISDMAAEFGAQCSKVELLLQSFKGKPDRFRTDELVRHLKANVGNRDVRISGVPGKPTETEIIRFLYQIGFLTARRELDDGDYRHYSFYDEPSLLSDGANDLGVSWEIPACFRKALQLSKSTRKMPR